MTFKSCIFVIHVSQTEKSFQTHFEKKVGEKIASDIDIERAIEKVLQDFKIDKLKEEQKAITVAALKKKRLHGNFTERVWKVITVSNVDTVEKNATDSRYRPRQCYCVFANNCVNAKSSGQIELYSKRESSLQR